MFIYRSSSSRRVVCCNFEVFWYLMGNKIGYVSIPLPPPTLLGLAEKEDENGGPGPRNRSTKGTSRRLPSIGKITATWRHRILLLS